MKLSIGTPKDNLEKKYRKDSKEKDRRRSCNSGKDLVGPKEKDGRDLPGIALWRSWVPKWATEIYSIIAFHTEITRTHEKIRLYSLNNAEQWIETYLSSMQNGI